MELANSTHFAQLQRLPPHLILLMHHLPLLYLNQLHFNLTAVIHIHTISHHHILTPCFCFIIPIPPPMHIPINTLMLHTWSLLLSWMHCWTPYIPPTQTMHTPRVLDPTLQAFYMAPASPLKVILPCAVSLEEFCICYAVDDEDQAWLAKLKVQPGDWHVEKLDHEDWQGHAGFI